MLISKGSSQRFNNLFVQEKYDDQTKIMENLLGDKYWDYYKYGDELKIGQLYAQRDIVFNPLQRGTYNFINTIPQWNRINEGNWAAVKLVSNFHILPKYIYVNAQYV